jgi:O-antigen ligase
MANPVAQKRIGDIIENEQSTFSGFNLKLRMWTALYDEVISKNLILGIGPVNQNEYIKSIYKKYQIKEAYKHSYNSHNQYIDNLLYHGLFGFLALLLLYLNNFLYGIVKKDYLLISIVIIFAVGSLTESLFLRQKGIVFFSFIIPLLFFNSLEHPQTKEKSNLP